MKTHSNITCNHAFKCDFRISKEDRHFSLQLLNTALKLVFTVIRQEKSLEDQKERGKKSLFVGDTIFYIKNSTYRHIISIRKFKNVPRENNNVQRSDAF